MARIGRNVTFNVTFETFTKGYEAWLPLRPSGIEPGPAIQKLSEGNAKPVNIDIWGELVDLLSLQTYVEDRGVEFTINGGAINTEPVPPPPEDPPDWDVAIAKQALINIITDKKNALDVLFQAEYVTLGGTNTPPNPEWKHYRWALNG